MTALAIWLFWAAAVVALVHVALAVSGFLRLWRWRRPLLPDSACPRVAVILCLRGPDPFLEATLLGLLEQDYPSYDLHIVVDHAGDPALAAVDEVIARGPWPNVFVTMLSERRETCSLKCSSLIQAVSGVLDTHDVVALIDADVVPHRTWLRELVAPLADERVGAATGNRWYMPARFALGALVRYLWNLPAVAQMITYKIPWAGTLALRTSVIREAGLLASWARGLCEDTPLFTALHARRLRIEFVPSLVMINRETIGVGDFIRWVHRQLLLARLYHPGWPLVVLHALLVFIVPAALLATLLAGLMTGNGAAARWAGCGLAIYVGVSAFPMGMAELLVRRIVRGRGEQAAWLTLPDLVALPAALVVLQAAYAAAAVRATWSRTVEWRRIVYRVDGPWEIRALGYRPYEHEAAPDALKSL